MSNRLRIEQPALFPVGRVPNLLTRDLRSVGELLADTDYQSRQLLLDLVAEDAPALITAWPLVFDAACDLWRRLPLPPTRVAAEQQARVMDLLETWGNGYQAELNKASGYLGDLRPDQRLSEIADAFTGASRLVAKFSGDVDVSREPAKGDLAAAQARLLHTLFLTVHAVHASTRMLRRDVSACRTLPGEVIPGLRGYRRSRVEGLLEDWIHRLDVTEAAISRAVNGRYPREATKEIVPAPEDLNRLPRALATWEIAAHRHLAVNPSNADITFIARGQWFIAVASRHVLAADPERHVGDLVGSCEKAALAWAEAATWWKVLTPSRATANRQLVLAAAELRAAVDELSLDHTHQVQPSLITQHPGYPQALNALHVALEDSRELAHLVAAYSRDPQLAGPAGSLARAARERTEELAPTEDVVWVSPSDIMGNKMVPVPRPVLEAIHASAKSLELASREVSSAAVQASAASMRGSAATASDSGPLLIETSVAPVSEQPAAPAV